MTMCKKRMGCVGVIVTTLWPAMDTERRLTYKNLLLKAQLGPAGPAANFHFTRDAFAFKTSCFESRFLLLNTGLSGRTTAPSEHSFGLGWISWFVEGVFQRRTSAMCSLWSLLLSQGKWGRWTACPQGTESPSPAALIRLLGSLPLKTK